VGKGYGSEIILVWLHSNWAKLLFAKRFANYLLPSKATIDSAFLCDGHLMAPDRRLAELARSLHRAAERLWLRVSDPKGYETADADIVALQKANTDLNRAITKLKIKPRPKK
jgi:hypothetical protein